MSKSRIEGESPAAYAGLSALERRASASADIVRLAVRLQEGAPGRERLDIWPALMTAVRAYNQAEADLAAAQKTLDGGARG